MPIRILMPHERVANGVEWLNEHGPAEWWDRVDPDRLDILDAENCILGQVFAAKADETGFTSGYHYVIRNYDEIGNNSTVMGFCDTGALGDDWRMNLAWENALHKLKTEVAA